MCRSSGFPEVDAIRGVGSNHSSAPAPPCQVMLGIAKRSRPPSNGAVYRPTFRPATAAGAGAVLTTRRVVGGIGVRGFWLHAMPRFSGNGKGREGIGDRKTDASRQF